MKTPFVLHRVLVAGLLLGPAVSPAATGFSGGIAWSYLIVVRYSDAEGSKQIAKIVAPDPGAPKSAISNSTIGDISIPGYLGGCPVTDIGWNAFYGCSGLTSITIPNSVRSIDTGAFRGCSGLTSITIPNNVPSIGSSAFQDCSGLTSITIPNSVTIIGSSAFQDCSGLTSITIPNSVTIIGSSAFQGCSGLTSITIPDSVTSIGWSAFSGCSGLTSITIPDSVKSISREVFKGCSGLTSITIPDSVTSIGFYAFDGCAGLTSIEIPKSITDIGVSVFSDCCEMTSITVVDDNPFYDSRSNCNAIIRSYDNALIAGCKNTIIPNDVTSIDVDAFCGCSGLMSITIPDSVTSIGDSAFYGCCGLTSITIPNSVTNIGWSAFSGCSGLTSITIPDSVTSIGWSAFSGCSGLTSITIPDSVKSISREVFKGCSGLTSITIPDSVTNISVGAFRGCSGLTSITIPNSVTSIWSSAFQGCSGLTSITIPDSVSHIEYDAFEGCTRLQKLYLPESYSGTPQTPPNCTIIRYNALVRLTVISPIGSPIPSGSGIICASNELISCSVASPVVDSYSGNIRYVCSGWKGTGSVPADGTGNAATFAIREDSSITWEWEEQLLLDDSASGGAVTELWTSRNASSAWFSVADKTASDGACLRSGAISTSETTSVETALAGPGTLSFKWKVPAGRGDYARVYLDDVEQANINRETEWQPALINIPAGEHIVRWSYERGSGSATGEDAAFLDDVDWRPQVSLAVSSAFGAASPAAGAHTLVYGDEVAASVATPEPADGTRRVCTGWTGTGSVPASGTETNATFQIEEDSSISWNWRTDHWIDVAVSGAGATDFVPQWVAEGEEVEVEIVPATHLYAISLSGATNGVTLAGTMLRFAADGPREICVDVAEVTLSLSVESEWGAPSPTNGIHSLSWGTEVVASVAEPEPADGFRYICTGWAGSGSVPPEGAGTNIAFTIDATSAIRWTWATNVWLAAAVSGPVEADFAGDWIELGSNVVVRWTPTAPYFTIALAGDTDGVVLDAGARTLSIPSDRPRSVTLVAKELTLAGALDGQGLRWTTDGAATWFPQIAETHDGEDAAKSGSILGDDTSALEVALEGPGSFSWSWKIDAAGNVGVDVLLDAKWIQNIAPGAEWARETLAIEGDGRHTVRFEFWNEGTSATRADCAYLDEVSWTGEIPGGRTTLEGEVPVPFAWLDEYDLVKGGDYEAAATAHVSNGANQVWECYVAGISPTNAAARFEAMIVFTNDTPVVHWFPDLNEEGTKNERVYTVEGKTNLVDRSWGPTNESTRFFRVKVEMP